MSRTNNVAAVSFAYTYNNANQRTRVDVGGTASIGQSYWIYQYDALGQVTSGKRYWADDTPVAGQQFEYGFDDIGNRRSTKAGGDQNGQNLRSAAYQANALNQYTNRTVPGYVPTAGSAAASAEVTANNQSTVPQNDYFWTELQVDNSGNPVVLIMTNQAVLNNATSTVARTTLTPPTPETFAYDADGNRVQDGLRRYEWDAENRLILAETLTNSLPTNQWERVKFRYDPQGRRIVKEVWNWNTQTNAWQPVSRRKYFWQNWNMVAEVEEANAWRASYLWGLDLSGTIEGAGGVGGLLAMIVHTGEHAGTYFYACDGNGNVAALVKQDEESLAAAYDYDPFGGFLRSHGLLAAVNPIRFSSKFYDRETGLSYYGFRWYDASTGTWPNRDPIEERGGMNLYAPGRNDFVNFIDPFGLNLYAIDGTGNDRSAQSNVPKFFERYNDGARYYYGGPGNPTDGVWGIGWTHGAGSAGIVKRVVEQICKDYVADPSIKIDIVGFSRGAAIANEVAWELSKHGCPCKLEKRMFFGLIGYRKLNPQVRFLGLFDTVHAYPWIWTWTWHYETIAPNVDNAAHALSRDETRKFFRPSILSTTGPTDLTSQWFDGRHSDIGGHFSMNQYLSRISLRWMVNQAVSADVRMNTQGLITDHEIAYLNQIGALDPGPKSLPKVLLND